MRSDEEAPKPALADIYAAIESGDEPSRAPLIPKGNPSRLGRLLIVVAALVPLFLLMATDGHYSFSVPFGTLLLLVASVSVLDAFGTFDDPLESPDAVSLRRVAPKLGELLGSLVALVVVLRLAVAGGLPRPALSSAVLVTGGFVWLLVSLCRVAEALRIFDAERVRWYARHGFWLALLNVLLYVPLLGSYSLSDPWETHYGEVAREMLARDDWLSLWWAQDGWFWSKPVLDFWVQALGFSLTGVRFMPDQMLAGAGAGMVPAPEWPARLPVFLLTAVAAYFLYKSVAKAFGARAGFLAGLVLTTAPYWYLIAHQSMTDMPYVAPLTAALSLVVLGMQTDPEARVRVFPVRVAGRVLGLSVFHLLFGCVLLITLPQLVYLLTRHVSLQMAGPNLGFRWHWDEFMYGSGGGNCGLPGNDPCRWFEPANRVFQPGLGALLWGAALGVLLFANRGERRTQRLYFLGAWLFTALSTLAKGAPGLVLPVVIAVVGLIAAKRYWDLARLELVGLALIIACVCLPWYVQMYMRHGPPFTDRLLFHDMYKRAFVHVHDTNTGDDVSFRYYVWQLGYGLFPWAGFAAAGLVWWLRFKNEAEDAQSAVLSFMVLWFTIAFAMFTITLTKFHHYALPTVAPIAALTGVMLDRALGTAPIARGKRALPYFLGIGTSAVLLVYGTLRLFPGALSGRLVDGELPRAMPALGALSILIGLVLAAFSARTYGTKDQASSDSFAARHESALLALLGVASAVTIVLIGRDLSSKVFSDVDGQARLLHLFTYNYKRPFPDTLDFNGAIRAFTAVSALLALGFLLPSIRRHALTLFCAVAIAWSAWGIDVYLVRSAPHWGQRETILAYYAERKGPEEPFIAYQMNWKGENFYTGNRVPAFVSSGKKFKEWVAEQKKKGTRVMFFTTEHTRMPTLKSELGSVKDFRVLTDKALNNKFALARVAL